MVKIKVMNEIKKRFLEEARLVDISSIVELIGRAESRGLLIEVVHTALEDMKNNKNSTPLLSIQVAIDCWDV
jgi:hypothetical protein